MNIMEAELKENESICFKNCCRLDDKIIIIDNEASKCSKMKFPIFKVSFAKLKQVRNKLCA